MTPSQGVAYNSRKSIPFKGVKKRLIWLNSVRNHVECMKTLYMITAPIIVAAFIGVYLVGDDIDSFEECVEAGNLY